MGEDEYFDLSLFLSLSLSLSLSKSDLFHHTIQKEKYRCRKTRRRIDKNSKIGQRNEEKRKQNTEEWEKTTKHTKVRVPPGQNSSIDSMICQT